MSAHLDWADLTETWTAPEAPQSNPSDFTEALRRRVRSTLLVVGVEVLLTIALLWVTWMQRQRGLTESGTATLLVLWGSWVVATCFAWWNRRGQWVRTASSTLEFVRLSRERAERKVRVAWFTAGMLLVQVGFLAVLAAMAPEPGLMTPVGWSITALVVVLYAGWAVRYHRASSAEREHFAGLERALGSETGP